MSLQQICQLNLTLSPVEFLKKKKSLCQIFCWALFMYVVLSCVQLFLNLWTVGTRLLCPWNFLQQAYQSGLPFPTPSDFPNTGSNPSHLMSPALAGQSLPLHHLGTNPLSRMLSHIIPKTSLRGCQYLCFTDEKISLRELR